MIDTIGRNRITVLIVLLALIVLTFGTTYLYVSPKTISGERTLSNLKLQANAKRSDTVVLRDEFSTLQERAKKFTQLEYTGLFETQNRLQAVEKVESFRGRTGLLKAKMDVKSGELKEDDRLNNVGNVYLVSPVSFELEGQDDLEIYTFMKMVEDRFVGQMILKDFQIDRVEDITTATLTTISEGVPTPMVRATVNYEWVTLPAEDELGQ